MANTNNKLARSAPPRIFWAILPWALWILGFIGYQTYQAAVTALSPNVELGGLIIVFLPLPLLGMGLGVALLYLLYRGQRHVIMLSMVVVPFAGIGLANGVLWLLQPWYAAAPITSFPATFAPSLAMALGATYVLVAEIMAYRDLQHVP